MQARPDLRSPAQLVGAAIGYSSIMRQKKALVFAISTFAIVGCNGSDTVAPKSVTTSLSFATRALSSSAAFGQLLDVTVTGGGNTLVLTKVQLVLRKIELKRARDGTCPESNSSSDDCEEMALGPILVDLPLTTGIATPINVAVPSGTYREIDLKLHKPGDDARDVAFKAANPAFADISVRVEGTFNGRAFVFTSRVNEKLEIEFNPPLVVDAAGGNVTVQIDPASWFRSATSAVIDPATANPGGANENTVRDNIRISFRALDDDDRDGR